MCLVNSPRWRLKEACTAYNCLWRNWMLLAMTSERGYLRRERRKKLITMTCAKIWTPSLTHLTWAEAQHHQHLQVSNCTFNDPAFKRLLICVVIELQDLVVHVPVFSRGSRPRKERLYKKSLTLPTFHRTWVRAKQRTNQVHQVRQSAKEGGQKRSLCHQQSWRNWKVNSKQSCIQGHRITHYILDNPKYATMTKKQKAQFGYYQRKKHFDKLGFKALTEYSSFWSNIYKWRDGMERLLQDKDRIEVQLADAVKVRHCC